MIEELQNIIQMIEKLQKKHYTTQIHTLFKCGNFQQVWV